MTGYGWGPDTNDYDEPLIICPNAGTQKLCEGCPCAVVHYIWECMTKDWFPECPDCEPLDDHQRHECDVMYEETHPVLIGDLRPKAKWGDVSIPAANKWADELLKHAVDTVLLGKFGESKPLPEDVGDTIKWRKYVYFDEETKEVSGKNPDGTTYPVAFGQKQIQPKEKT